MNELDDFIERIEEQEEDEQLVAWLQILSSFNERQDHPIVNLH